jgi:hypothetical protein
MRPITRWCDVCRMSSEFVHVNRAGELANVTRRTIYIWMRRDFVHSQKLPSGRLVICKRSVVGTEQPLK